MAARYLRTLAWLCALSLCAPAFAQDVTKDDILEALAPSERLAQRPMGARSLRGVAVDEGDEGPRKIDLKVQFRYDEAVLTDEAKLTLSALAAALQDEQLAGMTFEIIGHTDARGERNYNLDLSQRRAAAVAFHLASVHSVEGSRLRASGAGEDRLALPNDPESGENRRVEIRTATN